MPEILKYKLGENKFMYTFNGKVSGNIELELIRRIVTESKNRVYIISGCHGHSSGENWIEKGEHLVYKKKYLDISFYETLNYFMPELRKTNGKDFEKKLDKKSCHIVLCYCYTDRDRCLAHRHETNLLFVHNWCTDEIVFFLHCNQAIVLFDFNLSIA